MKKKYNSPDFEFFKVEFTGDALGDSRTESTIATETVDPTASSSGDDF